MARARSVEAKLSRLKLLRHDAPSPTVEAELRAALADASNLVVAAAAEAVTEASGAALAADLAAAFDRLMVEPDRTDKLCKGKTAVVEALNRLEAGDLELFRRGVRHVQLEPAFGGPYDAAAGLRAACAFAIVRLDRVGAPAVMADLLADPERAVRAAAARALGGCASNVAVPMLRLKARLGDKDPEVLAECFGSLLQLEPTGSVAFVAEFLAADAPVRAAAVLALGESRRPEALPVLSKFWQNRNAEDVRDEALLAFALLRQPAATDFLLRVVGDEPGHAVAAVRALAVLRHDPQVRRRTAEAVARAGGAALQRAFAERFRD